jgi:hypothetical protein
VVFIHQLNITPYQGSFHPTNYTFTASLNKAGGGVTLKLYEVDLPGGTVIPKASSILGPFMLEGENFVNVTSDISGLNFSRIFELSLDQTRYFKLVAEDAEGANTSNAFSEKTLTYYTAISFSSFSFIPTKGYPQTVAMRANAVMTEPPIGNISFIRLRHVTTNLFSLSGDTALSKFDGVYFEHEFSTSYFDSAVGSYPLFMQYKEAGMPSLIESNTVNMSIQQFVQIESLTINEDKAVSVVINKTVSQAEGNSYVIQESDDGESWAPVNEIIGISIEKRAFNFISGLTLSDGDTIYVKVTENLGALSADANGAHAISTAQEDAIYTEAKKAYWGVLHEGILNEHGYTFLTNIVVYLSQIEPLPQGFNVSGNIVPHIPYLKQITLRVDTVEYTVTVMTANYDAEENRTTFTYSEPNVSGVTRIIISSEYDINTLIDQTRLNTILTDEVLTDVGGIKDLSPASIIELPYQANFQSSLEEIHQILRSGAAHQWLLLPSEFNEYDQWAPLTTLDWMDLSLNYLVIDRTIGGEAYKLYVYRGLMVDPDTTYMGEIPGANDQKFRILT